MGHKLAGKSALIAGGSDGVGLTIARALAADGCSLHLAAAGAAGLAAAAEEIRASFDVDVAVHQDDLTQIVNIEALALECEDVDFLINAAGTVPSGGIGEVNAESWHRAWEIRVEGAVNLTRELYDSMCERGAGVVITVLEKQRRSIDPDHICVSTCNAALSAFTQTLGKVSIEHGVRVLGVDPGPDASAGQIGRAVTFLASDDAAHINGTVVAVRAVLDGMK